MATREHRGTVDLFVYSFQSLERRKMNVVRFVDLRNPRCNLRKTHLGHGCDALWYSFGRRITGRKLTCLSGKSEFLKYEVKISVIYNSNRRYAKYVKPAMRRLARVALVNIFQF